MRYMGQEDPAQMQGVGALGEVRLGADGNLYQWVEGIDGLGNPFGFWKKLRRRVRGFMRKALPIASKLAPFVPGFGPAIAKGLTTATPFLRRAGLMGQAGLGALYEAPDGTLYQQVQGLDAEELDGYGFDGDEELMGLGQVQGVGALGEVRPGADGNLYQWVEGIDGLGNPFGFWKKLRRRARGFMRKALPIASKLAPFVPGFGPTIAKGLTTATPFLRRAGLMGQAGLGALYEAPDGTLYQQVQGLDAEELDGYGFGQDELEGLDADDLDGLDEEDELQGLEAEDLDGLDAEDELDGYVFDRGMNGLDAYVPDQPPATRMFVPSSRSPEMWEPLW